jgi:hypothetical protein
MKTFAWSVMAGVCAVLVTLWVCHWRPDTLKRVVVSYSEKYEDKTIGRKQDYEQVVDDALFAEEQLSYLVARDQTCMVLSRDGKHADYSVNISVTRSLGDPSIYGEATLTVTRANGDILVSEHFYQDKNSKEDIAHQPITKVWEVLCSKK